jgi:hypothetical protein
MSTISNASEAKNSFRNLAQSKDIGFVPKSNSRYAFVRLPESKINQNTKIPGGHSLIGRINRLLSANLLMNENLGYLSSTEEWEHFYCFPSERDIHNFARIKAARPDQVVNGSSKSSELLRDKLIAEIEQCQNDSHSKYFFLRGTTGVGKTTFLKYHCKTQKLRYLERKTLISRVKFYELERTLGKIGESDGASDEAIGEVGSYLINCLVRDVIEALNLSAENKFKNNIFVETERELGNIVAQVEADLEQIRTALGKEAITSATTKDLELLLNVRDLTQGQIAALSLDTKSKILREAGRVFNYVTVLDGFDAINPEEIYLFQDSKQALFLRCLRAIVLGQFPRNPLAQEFFEDFPHVFLVAARDITVTQLKRLPKEILFDQKFGEDLYVIAAPVWDIVESRLKLRVDSNGNRLVESDVGVAMAACKRSLLFLKSDFKMEPDDKFVKLFNHNIREKLEFLKDITNFFLLQLGELFYREVSLRNRYSKSTADLIFYINSVSSSDLGVNAYEFEKILILSSNEKFQNFYNYDPEQNLNQVTDRGAFDNIFNYRRPERILGEDSRAIGCPLLVKLHLLGYVMRESRAAPTMDVDFNECCDFLDDTFGSDTWQRLDIQLLVRSWYLEVSSGDDGEMLLSVTDKGRFLMEKLLVRYSYFERVCLSSCLPKEVRDRFTVPKETAGGFWGLASIANVGVFLNYISVLEDHYNLPDNLRIFDQLLKSFEPVVESISAKGFEDAPRFYGDDLDAAFIKAAR